jgi:hypothetical protein
MNCIRCDAEGAQTYTRTVWTWGKEVTRVNELCKPCRDYLATITPPSQQTYQLAKTEAPTNGSA